MKRQCLVLLLVLGTGFFAIGQKTGRYNPNKYRMNLPSFWKPGSKAVKLLADRLPEVCEELKDKELCGDDCNPKYTIEFYMSEPNVKNFTANSISIGYDSRSYNIVTSYSFECALLLFDENDRLLTRINIINKDQIWTVTRRVEVQNFQPVYTPGQLITTNFSQQPGSGFITSPPNPFNQQSRMAQSIWAYIREHEGELYPTRQHMLTAVDNSIKDL